MPKIKLETKEEVKEEVVKTREEEQVEELRALRAKLDELGIRDVGQLDVIISQLLK